jgi:hypothetical protein
MTQYAIDYRLLELDGCQQITPINDSPW